MAATHARKACCTAALHWLLLPATLSVDVCVHAVRRDKVDISPDTMVAALQALQADFRAAAVNNSMSSAAVWQAVRPWDEVQVR